MRRTLHNGQCKDQCKGQGNGQCKGQGNGQCKGQGNGKGNAVMMLATTHVIIRCVCFALLINLYWTRIMIIEW